MLRILVVGCGSIGRRHAANFSVLSEVSVCDANASVAAEVGRDLGVHVFTDFISGLAWKPDGVILAVPNHLHVPMAMKCVEAGAHVYVEKPISDKIEGTRALLDRAAVLGKKVFVGCNMRYHPAIILLKENLPRIGKPLFARAHFGNYLPNMRPGVDYRELYCAKRESGGGVILDSIHEIDYLSWLLGPVQSVTCDAAKLSDLEMEVEDYASLGLRHFSGSVSQIQLDYLRPFKRRGCELVGDSGALLWESEGKIPEHVHVRYYSSKTSEWECLCDLEGYDMNEPFVALAKDFLLALTGPTSRLLKGGEALRELEIALEALEKSEMVER